MRAIPDRGKRPSRVPARLGVVFLHGPGGFGIGGGRGRGAGGFPHRRRTLGTAAFRRPVVLMYRPIREWARNYPLHLLGSQAWISLSNLQATLNPIRSAAPGPSRHRVF